MHFLHLTFVSLILTLSEVSQSELRQTTTFFAVPKHFSKSSLILDINLFFLICKTEDRKLKKTLLDLL